MTEVMDDKFKEYVKELVSEEGKRVDGRDFLEYRDPIEIDYDVSNNAEGSAKVRIGDTELISAVKLDVGEPYPDSPDEGTLKVSAEFSPLAAKDFEPGPPREPAIIVARVVDRGIRESGAIDTEELCIDEGELVWTVYIDIHVLNHDGNLIDAAALASIAALSKAKFLELDGEEVDYDTQTDEGLPIKHLPIACTFGKIEEDSIILDMNYKEEKVVDSQLTVTVNEEGNINALQKGGGEGLPREDIFEMLDAAIEKSKELRENLDN